MTRRQQETGRTYQMPDAIVMKRFQERPSLAATLSGRKSAGSYFHTDVRGLYMVEE